MNIKDNDLRNNLITTQTDKEENLEAKQTGPGSKSNDPEEFGPEEHRQRKALSRPISYLLIIGYTFNLLLKLR